MRRTLLVIPCYNEAGRLRVPEIRECLATLDQVELLLVDDGSGDDTLARLQQLRAGLEQRVTVLALARNLGKAEAVRTGILRALETQPAYVGYWDADLATPLEVVDRFRALLEQHPTLEMIFGARVQLLGRHIARRARRHLAGRVFATLVSCMLDLAVYDTQCGAKLFRVTPHLGELFADRFVSRWAFDVEIIARRKRQIREHGLPALEAVIYEHPLERWVDVEGSKLRPRDFLRSAWDLFEIWRRYR